MQETKTELIIERKRYAAIVDNILDAMIQIDRNGYIQDWNTQAEKIFAWTKKDVIDKPLHEIIIPARYRKAHLQGIAHFLSSGKETILNSRIEIFALHRDGTEFPIELSIASVKIDDDYEFHAFIRDISERKQAEKILIEKEQRYRLLVENSPYCIHELDLTGCFLSINSIGLAMLKIKCKKQILGKSYLDIVKSQDKGRIESFLNAAIQGTSSHFEFVGVGNKPSYFKSCFIPIKDSRGNITYLMGITEDITSQKESEILIWQQANFDSLTGLPNRCMFYERLTQEIKKNSREHQELALLVIDIDRFKDINDALGHGTGDLLLKDVALRLKSCVREMDMVARLGGDEFAFILSALDDPINIECVAEKILQQFSKPFQLQSQLIYVTASIGITLYPDDAIDRETLLKNADQAMYSAKEDGRGCYHYFTPFMQKAAQVRMQIASDLRTALERDEFQLHYQPIVNLKTREIRKAEALIRWQHPEHGLISPVAFIPIAEENRMIIDIGEWVFHEAVRQVNHWRNNYCANFQVSINKSPVQFQNEKNKHRLWIDYLQKLNLLGNSIVIEITEGLLLDVSSTVTEQLLSFRDAGIQISLDDFGTGYSSLSYLKKFDIDYLKIDQSFVCNLKADSDDMVLCEAIIVMAHKLGIKVIAEGIETVEQRDLLSVADCDYGQGYLFSRPIIAEQFEDLLKTQNFKEKEKA